MADLQTDRRAYGQTDRLTSHKDRKTNKQEEVEVEDGLKSLIN